MANVKRLDSPSEHAMKAHRESRGIILFFNLGARWGCVAKAPAALPPGKKTWYSLYRRNVAGSISDGVIGIFY